MRWMAVMSNCALRETNLDKLDGGTFDVLIVGGGINGAVSAAALSARGASAAFDRSRRFRRLHSAR